MTSSAAELLAVDGARLLARLDELAAVSAPGPGVTRLAYSAEDVAGHALVAGWLADLGLSPVVDGAGNLLATVPGSAGLPGALVTGSHLDTVVAAGPLDGAYGVVGAVEAAAALRGRLRHDLVVAAWSNEEGARGTPGMVGSHAAAGTLDPAALARPDDAGVPLRDRVGDIASAAWDPGRLAALVELHVEQGPVLEAAGCAIGAVDGITGQLVAEVTLVGEANHAGSTPMGLRHDALAAAAEVVLAVEGLALAGDVRVATCGRIDAEPGVRNAVPGVVRLSVDVRDVDAGRIEAAWSRLGATLDAVAARRGLSCTTDVVSRVAPAATDPRLVALVEQAAGARGLPVLRLPSGAGHDAQVLAALGPVAMVFVPSAGGVSHSAGERTEPADLVAGVQVLVDVLLAADAALDPEVP